LLGDRSDQAEESDLLHMLEAYAPDVGMEATSNGNLLCVKVFLGGFNGVIGGLAGTA